MTWFLLNPELIAFFGLFPDGLNQFAADISHICGYVNFIISGNAPVIEGKPSCQIDIFFMN